MKNNENRSSQSVVDSRGTANSGKKLIDWIHFKLSHLNGVTHFRIWGYENSGK